MSRGQRKQPWSATLPGGIAIEGVLPDSLIGRRALELVTGHQTMPVEAVMQKAMANQLRLCIKKIGDREVSWAKLRGGLLDRLLGPKQQHLVRRLFQVLTQPTEAETKYMRDTLAIANDDGQWRWEGTLLCGDKLERWVEASDAFAEAAVLLEDEESADEEPGAAEQRFEELFERVAELEKSAVAVSGILPSTDVMQRAIEQMPADARKKPALQRKEASENLVRLCLTHIDDQKVSFSDLKGVGVDDWLDPKEQALVIHALMELGTPQKNEEADFLSTVSLG